MKKFFVGLFFFLGSTVWAKDSPVETFHRVWDTAKTKIAPKSLEAHFTDETKHRLAVQAAAAKDLEALGEMLNPFLASLKVSHTHFYSESDLDYYFLRSLFSTHDLKTPRLYHIGAQFLRLAEGYRVRSVFEGYPAQKAGLRRGDLILTADGDPFEPVKSFRNGKSRTLKWRRRNEALTALVNPVYESIPESMLHATQRSRRVFNERGKQIAYLHLWSGTHSEFQRSLQSYVEEVKDTVDGFILDLRDGYGGAWYEYLDAFYPNRENYFHSTRIDREGSQTTQSAVPQENPKAYGGPLVVLINEGVRSGKESLAHQFKKTKRAKLVGEKTAGYFCAGQGNFVDEDWGYLLYLAVAEISLDGQKIEGVGISPDVAVEYDPQKFYPEDPQLRAARAIF